MSSDKLQKVEQKLDDQLKQVNRSTTISLAVYALLIVFFIVYLGYARNEIKKIDAEGISDIAVGYAEENIPEYRKELSQQLIGGAEENVSKAVDQLVTQIPAQRERVEKLAVAQVTKQLMVADESFSQLFRTSLQTSKSDLEPMLEKIKDADSIHEFEEEFYRILKQQVETPEIMGNIQDYGQTLMNVADKIEYLRTSDNLTEAEKLELDLLIGLKEVSIRSDVQKLDLGKNG